VAISVQFLQEHVGRMRYRVERARLLLYLSSMRRDRSHCGTVAPVTDLLQFGEHHPLSELLITCEVRPRLSQQLAHFSPYARQLGYRYLDGVFARQRFGLDLSGDALELIGAIHPNCLGVHLLPSSLDT
jgi:hypothetical protein